MVSDAEARDDPSLAVSGSVVMVSTINWIEWVDPVTDVLQGAAAPYDFFAIPVDEYYSPATVAYSAYRGRFVAAMPSFKDEASGCASGYLNVAISTTANPDQPWLRVRIPMPDAYADIARIGMSDDKVVLTTNEWDLDSGQPFCLGDPYEGSRIRVVDFADLIDGSTATIKDLSPGPATSYFNWLAALETPGTASTSAGATVDLIGDQNVGGWGHVASANVTGNAKANTAVLGGLTDLTTSAGLGMLTGPPPIPAIPGALFDERHDSVAGGGGRLWFAANGTCTPTGDTVDRACARYVQLDTTTSPPTVVEDGLYGTSGSDTFLPAVGRSRDGRTFLRMTRALSVAYTSLDQLVVDLPPGQTMEGGPLPVRFFTGSERLISNDWATFSTFAADPIQVSSVWNLGPTPEDLNWSETRFSRFRGGLVDPPDGSAIVNHGQVWNNSYRAEIAPAPSATSPIVTIRVSAQPTTETVTGGERLVQGVDLPVGPYTYVDLDRADLGGTSGEGAHSAWIQYVTGAGLWSAPFERSFTTDLTPPVITMLPTSRFEANHTVGTTASVRTSWAATDGLSGIGYYALNRIGPASWAAGYPASTTAVVQSLTLGKTYRYLLIAGDQAQNMALEDGYGPSFTPKAYQGTSTAISYYTTFSTATSSSYLGGSTRYSSRYHAKATFTFTGRSAAIVSTKGRTRGKFEVWVDGVKKATLDMYSSTAKYRQIVWSMGWPTSGPHRVMIRILATSGRPRVDVDAFLKF